MFKRISILITVFQFVCFFLPIYSQELDWIELKSLNDNYLVRLIEYPSGKLMAITNDGIFILQNNNWIEFTNGLDFIRPEQYNTSFKDAKIYNNTLTVLYTNNLAQTLNNEINWIKLLEIPEIIDFEYDTNGKLFLLCTASLYSFSDNVLSNNLLPTENSMNTGNMSMCIDLDNNIYISKNFGGLLYSFDQGLTWNTNYESEFRNLYSNNGILYSLGDGVRYSNNKGLNWTYSGLGYANPASIYFNNAELIVCGFKGVFLSKDNGESWRLLGLDSLETSSVNNLVVMSNGYLYAGTGQGKIFRTNQPLTTSLNNLGNDIDNNFRLNQNFPNPFNPKTEITFSIPKSEYVSLKVYDVLGREVSTLINSELSTGQHSIEWSPKNLSSGIYIYSLRAGSQIENKKMQYLK
ncbi:MAG: T9SS type A sorting domain-containing protein [Ignavibacteriae bacterium]|nr:T9SS type A sorting domain-containing protein [Ignavibacteriota bacterium]